MRKEREDRVYWSLRRLMACSIAPAAAESSCGSHAAASPSPFGRTRPRPSARRSAGTGRSTLRRTASRAGARSAGAEFDAPGGVDVGGGGAGGGGGRRGGGGG